MARNRKHKSVAIRFGPAIQALLLCALFVAAGVGYVWQKSLIADLNQQIKSRESELAKVKDQNKKLTDGLAGLKTPEMLNRRLSELNLGLVEPKPGQVWRLVEPTAAPVRRQFAARP